jgi:hypothetical protein
MNSFKFAQVVARVRNKLLHETTIADIHAELVRNGATPEIAHWLIRAAQFQNGTIDD